MINVIVAHSINRVIGKNGYIPWTIKNEQKQFKELTTNNIVVMGRKTYEEIGKALPNRVNVIITKKENINKGVICYKSLFSAIKILSSKYNDKDIYIIGGQQLFIEAMKLFNIDNYYITKVKRVVDGDKYFPLFKKEEYDVRITEENDEFIRYHYYRKEHL